jgi:hypothetical protein
MEHAAMVIAPEIITMNMGAALVAVIWHIEGCAHLDGEAFGSVGEVAAFALLALFMMKYSSHI